MRHAAANGGVRLRFAPHLLCHAQAVEMAREGVPLIVIQRQVGHTNRAKSGAAVNVPFVHLWTMRGGKAASFENVVDRDLWTQAWGG